MTPAAPIPEVPAARRGTLDLAVEDTAKLLHANCRRTAKCDWTTHIHLARLVAAVFTTENTSRRIGHAHTQGIIAGRYAGKKDLERLQRTLDDEAKEKRRLAAQLDNTRGQLDRVMAELNRCYTAAVTR